MNKFVNRKFIIAAAVIVVALIYIIKLINLQILNKEYKKLAASNSRKVIIKQPARGEIYDRNGKLLVYDKGAFNLRITPREVAEFDTLELTDILEISKEDLKTRLIKAREKAMFTYSSYVIYRQLSQIQYALLLERLYKFQGFEIETSGIREYVYNSASHVFGFVREVNESELKNDYYYIAGDNIGKAGIEKYYEEYLRGEKGCEYLLKDNKGRIVGRYEDGSLDKPEIAGKKITTTLDIELQKYGEYLMQKKLGGIVAIEPKSGEILVKVSAPHYDLSRIYDKHENKYFQQLSKDSLKILFDRTLLARYPPGSIFKIANALIGLQEGAVNLNTRRNCFGGFQYRKFRMGCHDHQQSVNVIKAIRYSCNTFFAQLFIDLLEKENTLPRDEYVKWYNHILSFGFGKKLGADFSNEIAGFIPDNTYYDKMIQRKKWRALNIVSLSIGQGELLITPLQMANFTAAVANKGYYYTPHIVKKIDDEPHLGWIKRQTSIDTVHFAPIIEGMREVVQSGTGVLAEVNGLDICGKTGTVQVHEKNDHSVFIAFAPRQNPKIAIIVYVENGGWGSSYAAPIAGLMIEKYLNGEVAAHRKWLENYIVNSDLIQK